LLLPLNYLVNRTVEDGLKTVRGITCRSADAFNGLLSGEQHQKASNSSLGKFFALSII
jgi:hypothetical protein